MTDNKDGRKPHVNVGTIGHIDHSRSTVTQLMALALNSGNHQLEHSSSVVERDLERFDTHSIDEIGGDPCGGMMSKRIRRAQNKDKRKALQARAFGSKRKKEK